MKKTVGFRLDPESNQRLDNLARATRIKKNTLIEMCIETHLPVLETKYADDISKLIEQELSAGQKKPARTTFPPHRPQGSPLNETPPKKKAT